jgi:ABC-type uncharacterized transport system substrate-binding protein
MDDGAGGSVTRRLFLITPLVCTRPLAAAASVAIVYRSGGEAFDQAVSGLKNALSRSKVDCDFLDLASDPAPQIRERYRMLVALGGDALEAASSGRPGAAAIASMALRNDIERYAGRLNITRRVVLDLLAADFVAELSSLLPNRPRLGLIRNPTRPGGLDSGLQALARQGGVVLQVAECSRADDLLPGFLSLRDKVDLFVAVPDGTLYNSATVKPLIMASLENRVPVVGFSASFVRAGAALGIYPDFHDVGAQTGDVTAQALGGELVKDQSPRRLIVGLNPKVVRLFGLDVKKPRNAELIVLK